MSRKHLPKTIFLQQLQLLDLALIQFNHLVLRGKYRRNLALLGKWRITYLQCSYYFSAKVLLFRPLCIPMTNAWSVKYVPIIEKLIINALKISKCHTRLAYCTLFLDYRRCTPYPCGFKAIYGRHDRTWFIHFKMACPCSFLTDFFIGI